MTTLMSLQPWWWQIFILIQLWSQFFQMFVYGDVVYAQTWYWPWKTVSSHLSYARTAYVVAIWPLFLFDSFVKIWVTCEIFLGKWFTAPPGKKFPYAYGLNWGQDRVFFIQENVTFIQLSIYQSHNQFLPAVNKMMKTKSLYILLPVSKFCVNLQYKKTCETLTEI